MIRRNTAGQVIYLPQLTTTDGTPITSSATLTVAKDGTEAASAGTLTHSSIDGVWKYTPTQAESDAAIVGLILTGSGAVPVVLNLITTGADTSAVALGANTTTPPTVEAVADEVQTRTIARVTLVDTCTTNTDMVSEPLDTIETEAAAAAALTAYSAATAANVTASETAITTILGTPAGASLAADIAAVEGGGSSLTGDYTLTITVTDADTDETIEAATVTLFRSGERGVEPTDDEGEAVFGVDAATWTWVVSKGGYQRASGTKVITGNDTLAVELTPIVVEQAEAPLCNVLLPVLDQYLAPAAEVLVCIEFLSFLPNATKTAVIVNHPPSLLSDDDGEVLVTLARLAKYRATYQVRGESPKRIEFSTPDAGSFTVVEA